MGAHPYFYFIPYQKDIRAALQALREREFKAGRYDPAMQMADPPTYMFQMRFPPDESWPSPGAQHNSVEEAIDASTESGTGSILDLSRVGSVPDFCTVCPLDDEDSVQLFGTTTPTREQLETVLLTKWKPGSPAFHLFWDRIERGQGRYIATYSDSEPREIFFVGYSFD